MIRSGGGNGLHRHPLQRPGLAILTALAATCALVAIGDPSFARYFGAFEPRLAVLACGIAGLGALHLLQRWGWIGAGTGGHKVLITAALGAGFAAPTILVDMLQPFPATINVMPPQALLFYPAIAVVVEVLFHLIPLTLLLGIWRLAGGAVTAQSYWIAALPVAMLEPAFQIIAGLDGAPGWRDAYLGLHLFAFSLVQLALLRRHGFLPMLTFRLVYYLVWHVLWGTARLSLLLPT